jgi:hypothetical protein
MTFVGPMHYIHKYVDSVMVGMLASSAVHRGFEHLLDQTKDYDICLAAAPPFYTCIIKE